MFSFRASSTRLSEWKKGRPTTLQIPPNKKTSSSKLSCSCCREIVGRVFFEVLKGQKKIYHRISRKTCFSVNWKWTKGWRQGHIEKQRQTTTHTQSFRQCGLPCSPHMYISGQCLRPPGEEAGAEQTHKESGCEVTDADHWATVKPTEQEPHLLRGSAAARVESPPAGLRRKNALHLIRWCRDQFSERRARLAFNTEPAKSEASGAVGEEAGGI